MTDVKVSFPDIVRVKNDSQSSVELKRNSKGVTEITIKVYNGNADQASEDARTIYNELDKIYR
jgi:hypothetical protein